MSEENKNLNEQAPEQKPVEIKKPLDQKTLGIIIGAAVAVVAIIAIVLALVLGGGAPSETPNGDPAGDVVTDVDYKLGMGVVVSLDSSKTGTAQVDATVATVVLDKDGKIVACRIDAVQNKVTLNDDGTYVIPESFKTKMELGTAYGMGQSSITEANKWMDNNGDGKVLEWDVQTKAFEAFVVGKTVAEVEAMATKEAGGHIISADDALLNAGCTIQITDFKAAVVKACKDEQGVSFKVASDKSFTLGVAAKSSNDSATKAATAETEGVIAVYSDFAASAVVDGKIVASLNDAIQPKVGFTVAGEIASKSFSATKRELKGDYHMGQPEPLPADKTWMDNNGDGKVKEWFEQSAAFSAYVVGMTKAEVEGMATQTLANGYVISNDEALLGACCTIQITGIKAVVAQSVAYAR